MRRIGLNGTWLSLLAGAALMAQPNSEMPRYVAVELSLDGAMRDAGAAPQSEWVGSRGTATGERHTTARQGSGEIDLHPAGAASWWAVAGDAATQVGSAAFGSHSHAMVWQGTAQSAVDLHVFLNSTFSDSMATGIDEAGNVTGVAIGSDGLAHDFLWRANGRKLSMSSGGGGNSGGGGSGGGGGGGGAVTDKVSITRALWFGNAQAAPTGEMLVQATSSSQAAILTMTDTNTGEVISILPNLGGGRYGGTVIFRFNPVTSVTVTSNLGGTNTRAVILGVQ